MEQVIEAPETVVLITQREIYALKDKRKELRANIEAAKKVLDSAESDWRYNEHQIRECATFLQEQSPDAVKGTWFDEMDLDE